tara:strand:+ start:137 stop:565 length:429 start_codon:yes stop_codon:yes gene_type:complete
MVTFRSSSNNRRPSFRNNNNRRPHFRRNDEGSKFQSSNFQRKLPNRNNNNAPKLIEKYNDLAREALANEDKILSENYFQHADHFTRVLNEQENSRVSKINTTSAETTEVNVEDKTTDPIAVQGQKEVKSLEKKTTEKKSVAS